MENTRFSESAPLLTRGAPILCVHGSWHGAWCFNEIFVPFFESKSLDARALALYVTNVVCCQQ